jgi:ribosomal protein L33
MGKKKFCRICGRYTDEDIVDVCQESHNYIIESIKRQHPEWVEKDGACPKCLEYYKNIPPQEK